jgi:hypothetical protein
MLRRRCSATSALGAGDLAASSARVEEGALARLARGARGADEGTAAERSLGEIREAMQGFT